MTDYVCVGLYDRDYMRQRISRRDPYFDRSWESDRPCAGGNRAMVTGSRWWALAIFVVVAIVGLIVLPQIAIAGRHWSFWFI